MAALIELEADSWIVTIYTNSQLRQSTQIGWNFDFIILQCVQHTRIAAGIDSAVDGGERGAAGVNLQTDLDIVDLAVDHGLYRRGAEYSLGYCIVLDSNLLENAGRQEILVCRFGLQYGPKLEQQTTLFN